MPRKKTTTKNIDSKKVRESFYNARMLAEDKIGATIAELVADGKVDESNAEFVTAVITQVVTDSITTVMASQDL